MFFLSAQPADKYFLWQLKIQLKNFSELGIKPEQFHILFGYDSTTGLDPVIADFMHTNKSFASFFAYPDTRSLKEYPSSIRPNIIKQHFLKYPILSNVAVFYHDADIVFTNKLPDFGKLTANDVWYVSDTRFYLDSNYIKKFGQHVFDEMCEVMAIDKTLVEENDCNTGGAQYIIKGTDYAFWDKAEQDCEKLYTYLIDNVDRYQEIFETDENNEGKKFEKIQAWCADMWVMFWNGLKANKTIKISRDLDFCWPQNPHKYWESMYIFHNSGITEDDAKDFFFKAHYRHSVPYDEDFSHVASHSCSAQYVSMFKQIAKEKYDLTDTTFLISVRIDSIERLENLLAVLLYIYNKFETKVLLLEADTQPKIFAENLPPNVSYQFVVDPSDLFHREKYNNQLALLADTDIIIRYDADVIVPAYQLKCAQISLKYRESDLFYPFNGTFLDVSGVYRSFFVKSLDLTLLSKYLKRFQAYGFPSYGGAIAMRKEVFLAVGMENENINGWGYEDQELHKKIKVLGYKIKRQWGPLYHLAHPRGSNSFFHDSEERLNSMRQYLKTCAIQITDTEQLVVAVNYE
jgi:hypothetical protein